MRGMESDSVNLVIADPPYNLGKDYGNNNDNRDFDAYLCFTRDWLSEAKRLLTPQGTLYVFMGVRFISYLFDTLERELGMYFNSWICWHYTQGLGRTRGFSPRHDDILMFTKSRQFHFYLDDVRVPQKYYRARNNMRGANPGDVWQFSHVHYCNENRQPHPTQKPEGLIERMVLASSRENDVVLDPFLGSGTTARVCQQLNRRCVGIEMNPEFVAQTWSRLAAPFEGFDSVDDRLARIPKDLNDTVRQQYISNHRQWFLKNNPRLRQRFEARLALAYPNDNTDVKKDVKNED
ncbi:MAG: site-specific DNA-methyltransferase [Deltaproteobacteria bacterium]|nr:site-specific DNA-methyltransferase [Deltaproteobacteria bacterium]MBN2673749.1 site-specific DNA-methyltransferase [Deltaproteobacteria bacterium]